MGETTKLSKLQRLNMLRQKAPDIEKDVTSNDGKRDEDVNKIINVNEEIKKENIYKKLCLNVDFAIFQKLKKLKYLKDISYTDFIISAVKEKLEKDYPKI